MLVGSLAAYSLARLETGGRHFSFWLLSQRLMPPVVLVVPFFLLLRGLGSINPALGLDSHAALMALYTVFNLPFVIWMMRSYFEAIPAEIEESALVDGSTRFGAFRRITLPLAVPGVIATGTFAFIFSWMEFLFAVVFTRTKAVTLPVAIAGFAGSQGSNWGQASALAVVAMLPVFALARRPNVARERIERGFATAREHELATLDQTAKARERLTIGEEIDGGDGA